MFMKHQLKGFIAGVIVTALLFTTVFASPVQSTISVAYNNIKLFVDGLLVNPTDASGNPVEPMVYNGTTYLPVRAVAQALGKPVRWDSNTNSIYIGDLSSTGDSVSTGASDNSVVKSPNEISWYFVGAGQQKDIDLVEAEANKYLKDKIDASIKITCFDWGSYEQKMTAMIASDDPFDICFTAVWINNYRVNALNGEFLPLNDLMDKYAPKTKALLGKDYLAGSAINGVNYAIPANKEKAHNWGFMFRKDLVEKYKFNIDSVNKLEDLVPILKTIKEKEAGIYPLGLRTGESPYSQLDWNKISDDDVPGALYPDNRDTKIVNEYEMPETLAMFTTLHNFYKAGYIRKDAVAAVDSYVPDQKAGNMFTYSVSLKPGKDAEMSSVSQFKWVQKDITAPVMSNWETTGSMMAISRTSKDPVLAMKFLELFNTDKYLNNLINFGVEEVDYTKISNNVIEPIQGSGYADMVGMQWAMGNQFINYLLPNEDPQKWEKLMSFNQKALPLTSLGFSFNMESVKFEAAACKALYREYMPLLETGAADPVVTLPEFVSKLKAAGSEKIITEMQKQYDEWLFITNKD